MRFLLALLWMASLTAWAQGFTHRGFIDFAGIGYPRLTANDRGHVVGEGLARYEVSTELGAGFRVAGGLDARFDTHQQTGFFVSWRDRERRRPALALRRLSVNYYRGKLSLEIGKQFISWGKVDFVRPTDRFAPQDYLNLVTTELLPVTAARLTYGSSSDSVDFVYLPWMTPSRAPLLNQRWATLSSEELAAIAREEAPAIPGGPQWGLRWSHTGAADYSLCFFEGSDHLPLFDVRPASPGQGSYIAQRFYPQMRMVGGDLALPLRTLTVKAEAAYFMSSDRRSDQYVLYVAQVERQTGEWNLTGGYAGEVLTEARNALTFSPVRGFTRAMFGRASYTVDVNRSLSIEAAVRQNGDGIWIQPEYTQAFGQHWRLTLSVAVIQGDEADFIGRYRRNQFAEVRLRYSF